jgi:hypothetical protein
MKAYEFLAKVRTRGEYADHSEAREAGHRA